MSADSRHDATNFRARPPVLLASAGRQLSEAKRAYRAYFAVPTHIAVDPTTGRDMLAVWGQGMTSQTRLDPHDRGQAPPCELGDPPGGHCVCAGPTPNRVVFQVATKTAEPNDEEASEQAEIWLHGQITCSTCGFRMAVSVPEGEVGHGFCPRCGAEHQAVGVHQTAVSEQEAS